MNESDRARLPEDPEPGLDRPHQLDPAAPESDVLASSADAATQRPVRHGRLVLVAAATAVALVLAGAAYAGTRLWYGWGAQPESVMPSSVAAVVRLDLSPGYGQRLAIDRLLKKSATPADVDATGGLAQRILGPLGVDEVAYRRDIAPWFAGRIGVAMWVDDTNRPYGLIALSVRNASAARTGLTDLRRRHGVDGFGFHIGGGYALVAQGSPQAQAAADTAARDAARDSLAASAQFRTDTGRLPARQPLLSWIDFARFHKAMTAAITAVAMAGPTAPRSGAPPSPGMFGAGFLSPPLVALSDPTLKGRLVLAAQATDSGVEIRYRGFGTASSGSTNGNARHAVDASPANAIVAAALPAGHPAGALAAPLAGIGAPLSDLVPQDASSGDVARPHTPTEALGRVLATLSGQRVNLAVTGLPSSVPAMSATAETSSADQAATLARRLTALGTDATITTSGHTITLQTTGYAAGAGTLAGQPLYRQALDGAPENADTILYIDVQRLLTQPDLTRRGPGQAKAVKAIALAAGADHGDTVGLLRILIR